MSEHDFSELVGEMFKQYKIYVIIFLDEAARLRGKLLPEVFSAQPETKGDGGVQDWQGLGVVYLTGMTDGLCIAFQFDTPPWVAVATVKFREEVDFETRLFEEETVGVQSCLESCTQQARSLWLGIVSGCESHCMSEIRSLWLIGGSATP